MEPFWAELRSEAANQEQAVSAANKPGASDWLMRVITKVGLALTSPLLEICR